MKLEQVDNKVSTLGVSVNHKFSIDDANMGFVYKSFINYSNPIGSIIREITSNCFDSHVEAGVDEFVEIRWVDENPLTGDICSLVFSDFGVGLSPERVSDVYCKFFTSTKRETNDQIGGFGIGAKSPLSYTNMFMVKTRVDGTQYTYSVHKGIQSPEMTLMTTEPTDAGNGTDVIIPFKQSDKSKVIAEINFQLKYFSGVRVVNISVSEAPLFMNDLLVYRNIAYNSEMDICIGRVRYPLNWALIPSRFYPLKNLPFGIRFNIGEIPVVWNREMIEYNDATIQTITSRFEEVYEFIVQTYNLQHKPVKSMIDAMDWFVPEKFQLFDTTFSAPVEIRKEGEALIGDIKVKPSVLKSMVFSSITHHTYVDKFKKPRSINNPVGINSTYLLNKSAFYLLWNEKADGKTNWLIAQRGGADVFKIEKIHIPQGLNGLSHVSSEDVYNTALEYIKRKGLRSYKDLLSTITKEEEEAYLTKTRRSAEDSLKVILLSQSSTNDSYYRSANILKMKELPSFARNKKELVIFDIFENEDQARTLMNWLFQLRTACRIFLVSKTNLFEAMRFFEEQTGRTPINLIDLKGSKRWYRWNFRAAKMSYSQQVATTFFEVLKDSSRPRSEFYRKHESRSIWYDKNLIKTEFNDVLESAEKIIGEKINNPLSRFIPSLHNGLDFFEYEAIASIKPKHPYINPKYVYRKYRNKLVPSENPGDQEQ